jgi:hypothetical protein
MVRSNDNFFITQSTVIIPSLMLVRGGCYAKQETRVLIRRRSNVSLAF